MARRRPRGRALEQRGARLTTESYTKRQRLKPVLIGAVKEKEERGTMRRELTFELSSNQRLPPQSPRGGMAPNRRERGSTRIGRRGRWIDVAAAP